MSKARISRYTASALLLISALIFARPAPAALRVVSTIFPLTDLVQQIGGALVDVTTLLPAGANPHTYEPTPAQMRSIVGAQLVVEVGAGLDTWVRKLLEVRGLRVPVLTITSGLSLLHHDEDEPGHEHGAGGDPHVWLDPILMRDSVVPALTRALIELEPAQAQQLNANAAHLAQRLTQLDAELRQKLAPVRGRSYVAFHSAWHYFANRYGLQEAAVIEPFPGKELSAREIIDIVEDARRAGAKALLIEPQFSAHVAEQVAREFGGHVVHVDPFGNAERADRSSYDRLLRYNAASLIEALQ